MPHRLGGRIAVLLLSTSAAACSNGGSSSSQAANPQVLVAGAMVDDPARNRVYVVDNGSDRLIAFDSATSALLDTASFGSPIEGVARDDDGDRVFVTLPERKRVEVMDAATLTLQKEFALNSAMHGILWRDAGRLVVATDVGMLLIDVDNLTGRTIIDDAGPDARIVQDALHKRVWCAFTRGSDLVVASVSPDIIGDTPKEVAIATSQDVPIGLALSVDETQLFVGSAFSSALFVVDATTLALTQTVPVLPKFTSMTVNRVATRLYATHGDSIAQEVPLDTFAGGGTIDAGAEIEANGAVVDATGASLVCHLADASITAVPAFEDRLVGKPIIVTGTTYTLKLIGSPSQPFTLVLAKQPGFFPYGPPADVPRKFLDIDPATFQPLLTSTLDASGEFTFSTVISTASGLAGVSFLLQAIVVDPNTGQPGQPTNAIFLRILDP
jgi:hypothetical protein